MKYIGNCTEDEAWQLIFTDASDMAYAIENSFHLNKEEFLNRVGNEDGAAKEVVNQCLDFGTIRNIVWAYDDKKDVHYFWAN